MIKDNKFTETSLEELYKLQCELAEKENHLQTLNIWYNNERDDKSRKGILKDIKSVELKIKEIKNKMTEIKNKAHLKDSMDMLKLMGFAMDSCGEKVYTKGEAEDECKDGGPGSGIKGHITAKEESEEKFWENKLREVAKQKGISESDIEELISQVKKGGAKTVMSQKDDDATEMGSFEQLGQNHETEAMEPEEHPVLAQDGYNFEDPKVIEEAIKKVEASGHPDKDYLAGLKRALELAKKERSQKDSMISEVLNPLKESWSRIKELSTEDASDRRGVQLKIGDMVEVFGKRGKITKVLRGKNEADDVIEVFFDNSGTFNPDRTDRYYANEVTKDSDPKVAEANKLIELFGGVK